METTKPRSVSEDSTSEQTTPPTLAEDTTMPTATEKDAVDVEDEKKDKAADAPAPETEYPGPLQFTLIMVSLLIAMFLISLDQTIVATAIPRITDDFQGLSKVSWYGSAYFLTFAGFMACWGKAVQYASLKYSYLAALFLFEVGSLICAVAPNANALIVGRAVAGVGCSGVSGMVFVAVVLACPPQRQPIFMGIMATTYGISAVVGPLMGGAFTGSAAGWRWCFWINLPVGGVAAAITVFSFQLSQPKMTLPLAEKIQRLDLGGAALAIGAMISAILALQYGGQSMAWRSATVVGLLVGSAAMGGVWLGWQAWQGDRAMIVLRVVRRYHGVWSGSLFQFFFSSSYFVGLYYLPIYFQSVSGASPIGSGVHNLPLVLSITFSSIVCGGIISRVGRIGPFMAVAGALATVACGLFYTLDEHSSAGRWIGFQILAGVPWGGAFQCGLIGTQAGLPKADIPLASTVIMFTQTVGSTLAISAAQSAFNNTLLLAIKRLAPHIDPQLVLATGATDIRTVFTGADQAIVIHAYIEALRVVWGIAVALAGLSFLASFLCRWDRLFPKSSKAGGSPPVVAV